MEGKENWMLSVGSWVLFSITDIHQAERNKLQFTTRPQSVTSAYVYFITGVNIELLEVNMAE